jgi:hypothetical protein
MNTIAITYFVNQNGHRQDLNSQPLDIQADLLTTTLRSTTLILLIFSQPNKIFFLNLVPEIILKSEYFFPLYLQKHNFFFKYSLMNFMVPAISPIWHFTGENSKYGLRKANTEFVRELCNNH